MSRPLVLPSWASLDTETGVVVVNADEAYPAVLAELGVEPVALEKGKAGEEGKTYLDQYWAEVAYQVIKLDVQSAAAGTELMKPGKMVTIRIKTEDKDRWKVANLPKGLGVEAATKGQKAREVYRQLRGFIPA